jgi:hypothetical protein
MMTLQLTEPETMYFPSGEKAVLFVCPRHARLGRFDGLDRLACTGARNRGVDSDGLPLEDKVEVFFSGIDGCGGLFSIGIGDMA